jgi:hypothetical protein
VTVDLPLPEAGSRPCTFFVQAATRESAQEHVLSLLQALLPGRHFAASDLRWEAAEPFAESLPPGVYGHHIEWHASE